MDKNSSSLIEEVGENYKQIMAFFCKIDIIIEEIERQCFKDHPDDEEVVENLSRLFSMLLGETRGKRIVDIILRYLETSLENKRKITRKKAEITEKSFINQ